MEKMLQPLKKYADFQGRARRSEFWLWELFLIIVYAILYVPLFTLGMDGSTGQMNAIGSIIGLILGVFALAIIIPSIAVTVRRLHDTNRSGWWIFLGFVPLIGGIVLLIFYVLDGTPGPNKYGEDPKGRHDTEVFS
jgi:uncharacterized membrane protein YhaH (DUF805 family)